ncbi:MAG: SDR family oxidoreductase [Prochloraceae cyanobacterium]|nr:SDR family oxidoreductase [Prochloraceae cyanobacterium]
MTTESYIFLAGASRGVGREIANYLTKHNQKVKAMLRSPSSQPELEAMGVEVVIADAFDRESVEKVMLADKPPLAIISTIGGVPKQEQRPDYIGNKNLIDAAVKAKVEKFILITSIGTAESAAALNEQALSTLGKVLKEKEKAEKHLTESGLTYTIIRPGGLKSEPATGNGILTENYKVAGTIHRADVAKLTCECLYSQAANNKILSAVDRNMMYFQTDFEEFKLK